MPLPFGPKSLFITPFFVSDWPSNLHGTKTLYDRLASRLMADNFLYLLTPIETSNVVWAYGKLGFQNEVMLLALANRIMQPYFLDACAQDGVHGCKEWPSDVSKNNTMCFM